MKIRVRFSKQGMMKFIGHLDMVRYFQKVHRRADLDVVYSEGFSPHQKMSFASPLSVGLLSRGEYYDLEVASSMSSKEMIQRMNEQNVEGVEVLSFKLLPDGAKNCMSIVAAADYLVHGNFNAEKVQDFLSQKEIQVLKKTKKSEKIVDIRPMIYEMNTTDEGLYMKVAQGSAANLKPDLVIRSLFDFMNEEVPGNIVYERLDMYCLEGEQLISLDAVGEEIIKH
ncbi:MAG: TIGR03936 family radical SAM-associated protein [Eubacterium sp.]|nr:TIGR03936 family radical SAM-associated protein [Eubacterium sp.]